MTELKRVKQYFAKIQKAEEPPAQRTTSVNTEAATRILKADLSELVARLEDRLVREPLPLPPQIDPDAVAEFDYRRVYATGRLRHDREMLIGPRMRDGEQGYMVVTPLERDGDGSTVLVNRGWISKKMGDQRARSAEALPTGEITVEALLREPWKKNMFTPDNRPDKWEFYFPDVKQMAAL
ncbi:hypothetical protein BN1708_017982, partial [Verticillium longisporum]